MIATPIRSTVPHVTREQLDRCHPIFDYQRNEWFYQVDSEWIGLADPYEVRYHAETDTYTCTCPCGLGGFASCRTYQYCKHVYWASAHCQHVFRPQFSADVSHSTEQPPVSDVAAREDSWLNDVPRSDVQMSTTPALYTPPTWIN